MTTKKEDTIALPEGATFDVLPNDYHRYQLNLRFRLKRLEEDGVFNGEKVKAGDYIGLGSDGGLLHLTEEELREHYEPIGPGGASS